MAIPVGQRVERMGSFIAGLSHDACLRNPISSGPWVTLPIAAGTVRNDGGRCGSGIPGSMRKMR